MSMHTLFKDCMNCKKVFFVSKGEGQKNFYLRKNCSRKCAEESRISMPKASSRCTICMNIFVQKATEARTLFMKRRTCSRSCSQVDPIRLRKVSLGNSGKNHWTTRITVSEETRNKHRISRTGSRHSKEAIEKMKKSAKRGSSNPAWKGGITPLKMMIRTCPEYKRWRSEVFLRDNYKCTICEKGGGIEADHIIPFSAIFNYNKIQSVDEAYACDFLWDIKNGRTLCVPCHKFTDTYGVKAKMSDQDYLNSKDSLYNQSPNS